MALLGALQRYSWQDWKWFLSAWFGLARIHWTIKCRDYSHWRHWISESCVDKPSSLSSSQQKRLIAVCEAAGRHHIIPVNCLRRCLSQKQLLARYGQHAELVFGVKKQPDGLAAHCWLTVDQQIINDTAENCAQYTPLGQFSAALFC